MPKISKKNIIGSFPWCGDLLLAQGVDGKANGEKKTGNNSKAWFAAEANAN